MKNKIECRQMIYTVRPGYYEWNIFKGDELLYTIEDGSGQLTENLTEDITYSELREVAEEYIEGIYTEKGITERRDFNSVVNALTDAWAYHFGIDKQENKLKIKLSDGRELVAEVNNYDGENIELCVYVEAENSMQDICLIREGVKNDVECLVWADPNNEDYTDFFNIGKYESEE